MSALPTIGGVLLLLTLLLAALAAFYVWRRGRLTLPALGGRRTAEDEAKRILAERFARGDITTEDFMERASILNWTPGTETTAVGPRRKRT